MREARFMGVGGSSRWAQSVSDGAVESVSDSLDTRYNVVAMPEGAVRAGGGRPLYQQLRSLLRDRIERGLYAPGDAFPSESELIAEHAMSRITVRRAIAELRREGLVVTRQGAGTYVADPARAGAQCLVSFTSETLRRGRAPGSRLVAMRRLSGPAFAARRLGLPDDAALLQIKRVRSVDDRPVYLSDAYVPAALLPDANPDELARSGLDQSLYRLIERHHPVPLEAGEEVASAVFANEEVREIFELPERSPVIRKTCLLRDSSGSPIIYEEATWGVPEHSTVVWRQTVATAGDGR
jgi:GntR family transcriptional regulator